MRENKMEKLGVGQGLCEYDYLAHCRDAEALPTGYTSCDHVMGASRKNGKYLADDDEREKLLQTIPPGNVRARGIYGSESGILEAPEVYKSRWRSIRVMYLTMFLSSVSFSICMSSLYPYLKVLDHSATTDFLGWVVAAYSVGQLIASPFFGAWSNYRKKSREPIVVSLTVNVLANILYMYLESMSHDRAIFLVLARALIGFGAGNVAVVRSYVSGATTLKERTPAMANMSACQAVGFIIGPVIQTAMVPIGFPGPVHSPGFHLDMYTATALLSALVGVINIVLLVVVFKEHRVPDEDLIPDIQGSVIESIDEIKETPLDYLAVISSIILFFSVLFIFSVFETIATPLSMHMFAWTKAKATLLIGVVLGCAGVVSIVVFVFIKILSKRFNERYLLLGGFLMCLLAFIIYLPWGSNYPAIQFADYSTVSSTSKQTTSLPTMHTDITAYTFHPDLPKNKHEYISSQKRLLDDLKLYYNWHNNMSKRSGKRTHVETVESTYSFLGDSLHRLGFKQPMAFESNSMHKNSKILAISRSPTTRGFISSKPNHNQDTVTTHEVSVTTENSSDISTAQTASHIPTTSETSKETTESSTTTTVQQTTSSETTKIHTSIETTESSSKPSSSQETTAASTQSTSPQAPTTEHTTIEDITTELIPNITTTAPQAENTTSEAVGCPYYYHWCYSTPAILLWQFLLGTLFVAVGYPTCNVMSYTIYSKILGPKPQGIWMGWLTAAGSLARCLGPVFVSQVYDAYGPRVTFISISGLIILTIVGFLVVSRRLVPFRTITVTVKV